MILLGMRTNIPSENKLKAFPPPTPQPARPQSTLADDPEKLNFLPFSSSKVSNTSFAALV